MKKRWVSFFLAAGVAASAIYLSQCSADGKPIADSSLRLTARKKDLVIEVIDTGKVQPKERIEIKSKVAGQVLEVAVEEGRRVEKGQLLLRLDPTDFERDVARAEADVAQAKIALEFATLNHERKKRGLQDRGVAQIDVDFAHNEVKAKTVAVRAAEVSLATAQDRLRYTRITSPIAGTIMELGIQKGEVVTPGVQQTFEGRPLMTIGDLSTLLVRTELNQIDIAKIALEQKVTLTFDALPGKTFTARVTKTAPAGVKPKNKDIEVFPVEATLSTADPSIKPGMTADVRFLIDTKPAVLSVPIEAVVKDKGKTHLTRIVLAEGKEQSEKVEVQLGARNDREVEIVSGITEGQELLIDPASSKENEVEL